MRVLLDHCVDWRLGRSMPAHTVRSTRDMRWEHLKNGKLLSEAAAHFDVLLTVASTGQAAGRSKIVLENIPVLAVAQTIQRKDEPQVERIDGLPAAIAVTRNNISRSNRATIGTTTTAPNVAIRGLPVFFQHRDDRGQVLLFRQLQSFS